MPRMRVRLFYRLPIAVLAFLVVGSIPVRAGTFTAFGPKTYVRQTGTPVTVTDTFSAVDPSVHYSLRVTNSRAASGKDEEVSRAFVTINGVQVIDPSQFGHTLSVVQVAVPLLASNQIAVRVLGAPGGAITVEIIGGMVGSFTALGPKVYQRGDDDSVAIINMFSVADPSLQYVLRVTNSKLPVDPETDGKEGTDDERSGVSRTLITINGIRVVSPVSFGHIVSTLEVPILLQTSNQIGVEVRGKQGGKITVEISGGLVGPFSVFGAKTYRKDTKDSDDPQSVRDTFSVANPGAPYTLLLANSSIHGLSDKDDDSEKGVSKATVSINGVRVVDREQFDDIVSAIEVPVNLLSSNQIDVQVSGRPGGTITAKILGLDTDLPTITAAVVPPPNAVGWNNTNVTVTFACGDATSGVANCPAPIIVTGDGASQVISGTATDTAGNAASTAVIINLDKTPPTIVVSLTPSPNGAGWNKSNVSVIFVCSDSTSRVASCTAPTLLMTEGANQTVAGTAVDNAGNAASTSVTINLDKTPPNLAILSPPNGQTISLSTTSITVIGSESDTLSGVAGITCNGAAGTISGSKFACTISLTQGSNPISVQAGDVAGNTSTSPLTLVYAPAPQVRITAPANLSVTNLSPVTVNGTVNDPSATLTVNGIPAPQSSSSFSIPVPLVEGLNILTAVATNSSGVTSTTTVQVTLDTTPPHITIDSPTDGATTTAASLTVTGLANDVVVGTVNALDVQVAVNGIAAQVANRTYSAANVPLSVGPNTIQAKAVDRAGNAATTSITVTRALPSQPPPPAIGQALITQSLSIISGNNQTGTVGTQLAAPLVAALTDTSNKPIANQMVVFKVTGNNGTINTGTTGTPSSAVAVTTDVNGQGRVFWSLGQRSGAGINIVHASSPLAVGSADFTATGIVSSPATIVVDSGNGQTGVLGQPLPFPFVVAVVDSGHNRVPNVSVTFTVKRGGGNFGGLPSETVNTDSNGRAIAVLTPGLQEGFANNVVEASFPGNTGFPAAFAASAAAPGNPANTTISGVVLDNSNNPIQGATIRLFQTNQGNNNNLPIQVATPVQTNARGTFLIQPAPVGFFKLMADGTTAVGISSYPTLEYDIVTVAGNNNTVGMPIYLPALDTTNKLCVDSTHGGTLALPQVPGFSLMVLPGSATFPGGSKQGCITVTPVNGDKVPMAPGFGQQPRFIVTIQPVGTTFNPPAPMTLPNVDGLQPKAVTEMYSYDHDLGMFIAIGTGTVSDDGSVIASNPGVGVLKAGWHCGGNPNSSGSAGTCPDCEKCAGTGCVVDVASTAACDDHVFCTVNDVCMNGVCSGTPIPDGLTTTKSFSVDLTAILGAIGKAFSLLGVPLKASTQFSGELKETPKCCEDKQQLNVSEKEATFSLNAKWEASNLPIPCCTVKLPPAKPIVQIGLFADIGVSAGANLKGTNDLCKMQFCFGGGVSGGGDVTFKGGGVVGPPNDPIISAFASGTTGIQASGGAAGDCKNLAFAVSWTGVTIQASFTLFDGFTFSDGVQLIPPSDLGKGQIPLPVF